MAFSKKTWKDRVSEQPQRRLLTPTAGGSAYTVDVTRQEGIVVQEGDAFSAANMNDLETRIKNALDSEEATIATVNNKANTNASNISTLQSNISSLNSSKAPNNHASTNTTYGVGSTTAFGHLKITDEYTGGGTAASGIAASQYALKSAYNALVLQDDGIRNEMRAADTALGNLISTLNSRTIGLDNQLKTTGASPTQFYFDYQNGKYGYNTSANRGADTFHPFSSAPEYVACVFNNSSYWAGGNISVTEVATGTMIARGHKAGNVDGDYDVNVFGSASLGDFTINWVDTDNVRQVIANTAGTYVVVTRSFKALQASSVSIQDVVANAMLYNKNDRETTQDEMVTIWKLY